MFFLFLPLVCLQKKDFPANLSLSTATMEEMFFSDPHFGNHRANLLASVEAGCDYCFWMIHFRNRQLIHDVPISTETSSHLPTSLDTNLVCMFAVSFLMTCISSLQLACIDGCRIAALSVPASWRTSRLGWRGSWWPPSPSTASTTTSPAAPQVAEASYFDSKMCNFFQRF